MKNYFFTLLIGCLIFSTSTALAQAEKDTIWYDANWNVSTKNQASYFRPEPAKKDKGYWLNDYYMSGAIQMKGLSLRENEEFFDGLVTWYYENGNVMQTVNWKNNVKIGERKDYHESGTLKSQYSYTNDLKEGDWVGYHENSKLSESGKYLSDKRNGPWKEFHKSGKLKGEGNYTDDKKTGIWKMYFYDGVD